jgi:ferrochelatase
MSDDPRHGVLLVNLGTPDAPHAPQVRRYLREFLMDERVIDISPVARWLLVQLVIAPFRAPKSAAAYRKVWTPEGSPLLIHGKALRDAVAAKLPGVEVELAMRYGNPSIPDALDRLRAAQVTRLTVLPLYPQYAASSTASTIEAVQRHLGRVWDLPGVDIVPNFFDDAGFLAAWSEHAREHLDAFAPDHVLFSYHGLPERQIVKSDPTLVRLGSSRTRSGEVRGHCLATPDCCERARGPVLDRCYRAQCYSTTRALVADLQLDVTRTSTSFQSRLGRVPWIKPYTDDVLVELARAGTKRLAVLCPAFVADCLETLEEIGDRAREDFRAAGGEDLALIPCLNAHPRWVDAVVGLLREHGTPALG